MSNVRSLLLVLPVVSSLVVPTPVLNHLSVLTSAADPFTDPAVWGNAALATPDCATAASGNPVVAWVTFYVVGMGVLTAWCGGGYARR